MKAVLLVGGEGTRLRPLTYKTPKAMVPIVNRPFLEHFIAHLRRHGIKDIILTLCYLPDPMKSFFGDGKNFGASLVYEQEKSPMGTAGAVKNVDQYLDDTFLVFNGDVFTDLDLSAMLAFHRKKKAVATIALTPVEDPSRFGVVETDKSGRVGAFIEKPPRHEATTNMINAGTYVLEPEILKRIPAGSHYMFERCLFPDLLSSRKPVYAFPSNSYWIDIGTPENYYKVQMDLLCGKASTALDLSPAGKSVIDKSAFIEATVVMGEGCHIGPRVRIKGPAVLGPGCSIGANVIIDRAILWGQVKVDEGASLSKCVVAANSIIGAGSDISEACILGEGVVIKPGTRLAPGSKVS